MKNYVYSNYIWIVSIVFYLVSNQVQAQIAPGSPAGSYYGEYQWVIRHIEHNWVQKIYGNTGDQPNGVWGDKFYLKYKIETVSFPFLPNFTKSTVSNRVLGLPTNTQYDASQNAWSPYNTVPTLYRVKEDVAVGSNGGIIKGGAFEINNSSTLISKHFEDSYSATVGTLAQGFNYGNNNTRDYYPHTILKHTLYLCDINTNQKIDSLSFLRDNTRTHNKFPWYKAGQNNISDLTHDIAFYSSLEIPNDYAECYAENGCIDYAIYTKPLFSALQFTVIPSPNNELYDDFNTIQLFPYIAEESRLINGVLFCPPSYDASFSGNNMNYIHPAPFSLNVHHNDIDYPDNVQVPFDEQNYSNWDNHIIGEPHHYEIDQNIDLTLINPDEKIIYNPISADIYATDLVFPSGYQFRTYPGLKKWYMNHVPIQNYRDADPTRFFEDPKDIPVKPNVGSSSKYYVKSGATLTIEPCVELYDVEIIVQTGGTLKYNAAEIDGRFLVTPAGGNIVNNYSGYTGCYACRFTFDKNDYTYTGGAWTLHGINRINRTLRVKAGTVLDLTNQTIEFGQEGRLIVEVGAKLILDNSILTSSCLWNGVEVYGNPDIPYVDGTALNNNGLQGIVIMRNGSTIRNARTGIKSIKGGMVFADQSLFVNNKIGVHALNRDYSQVLISRCQFLTNGSFIYENGSEEDMNTFIKLTNAHAVVRGNTFTNFNNHYSPGNEQFYGTGILCYNSRLRVSEYSTQVTNQNDPLKYQILKLTDIKNRFENLHSAIDYYGTGGISKILEVRNTDFINVGKGITSNNGRYDEIIFNHFELDPSKVQSRIKNTGSYAVYALNSESHLIAENEIMNNSTTPGGFGIVNRHDQIGISNSVPTSPIGLTGEMFKNTVENVYVSTQSEGFNPLTVYECNDFETGNEVGFRLMDSRLAIGSTSYKTYGLQGNIGECSNGETAANTFNPCTASNDQIINLSTKPVSPGFNYADKSVTIPDAACTAPNVLLEVCLSSVLKNECKSLTNPSRTIAQEISPSNGLGQSLKRVASNKDELMRYYIKTLQWELAEELLNNETALEAKRRAILHDLERDRVVVSQHNLDNYPGNDPDDIKFKEFAQVMIDLKRDKRTVHEMTNLERTKMENLAQSNSKVKVAAESVLAMADDIQLFRVPEDSTSTGPDSLNAPLSPYVLEVAPNPAHQYFEVDYDLVDKQNGTVMIKDAISGMVVKTITLSGTSGKESINIASLKNGNYIVVLEGDQTYLSSKHLMKY